MSERKIICPYCFGEMMDDEVLFRSEIVNKDESDILPDEYDDVQAFADRYRGADKEEILSKLREWEFFTLTDDEVYETFWSDFNGTTEYDPTDEEERIKPYRRRVIDPQYTDHQRYLTRQEDGSYFIRDADGMVTRIELNDPKHTKCHRRVCRHCHNPLPQSYGKTDVNFATVIGITGAGKTVYISQLLNKLGNYVAKVGLSAIVNSPSCRTFLRNNPIHENMPLPGSTPAGQFQQPLFYQITRNDGAKGRITETFVLYDVAGEVFKDYNRVERYAPFIEHANGLVMLLDPGQFDAIRDLPGNSQMLSETTAVLTEIHNIVSHGQANVKCDIPIAVCLSKIDRTEVKQVLDPELCELLKADVSGEKEPSGYYTPVFNAREYNPIAKGLNTFIQENEPALAQLLQTNYEKYAYFAFTALGCDVREGRKENGENFKYPVGPILTRRVEEPLLWLFNQLGYIGENEEIFKLEQGPIPIPVDNVQCTNPTCGSFNTYMLPPDKRILERRALFGIVRREYVDHCCKDCGHKWEHRPEEV